MTNKLRDLLAAAIETGQAPTAETLKDLPLRDTDLRQRAKIRQALFNRAAALAAAARRGESPEDIADNVEDTIAEFGPHTGDVAPDASADAGNRSPQGPSTTPRADLTAFHRLRDELLTAAASGRTIDPENLDTDLSASDATKWRGQVARLSERVTKTHRSGDQGGARSLIHRHAIGLADGLRVPEPPDPTEGVTDPAALAALIPR